MNQNISFRFDRKYILPIFSRNINAVCLFKVSFESLYFIDLLISEKIDSAYVLQKLESKDKWTVFIVTRILIQGFSKLLKVMAIEIPSWQKNFLA